MSAYAETGVEFQTSSGVSMPDGKHAFRAVLRSSRPSGTGSSLLSGHAGIGGWSGASGPPTVSPQPPSNSWWLNASKSISPASTIDNLPLESRRSLFD